jgi:preprotein translocase subunit YajC
MNWWSSLPAAAQPQGAQQGSPYGSIFMMLLIVGVFYFLVFMPARRRQKKHQEMIDALKTGDRVVTTGGIFGTVTAVEDHKIQLRIASEVKIDVAKSAVAALAEKPE